MAHAFPPREIFVIPSGVHVAGQVDRNINTIKIDNAIKTPILAILNGNTTDQGGNPNVAIGPMGHTLGHVDFATNIVDIVTQITPISLAIRDIGESQ